MNVATASIRSSVFSVHGHRHEPSRHHRAAAPTYFTQPYPADTLLWVAGLAQPDWLIEIDAIALTR
jgi:enamine deaminase RidA (YjgF/YER057c/UK114 family)